MTNTTRYIVLEDRSGECFDRTKSKESSEIWLAACAQVTNQNSMIFCYLEENLKHGRLFWHDLIPETEIWLKIGGDKGGGSFKMAFEIANTKNPNAKCNTVVFSAFEAPDNASNIKLALGRYLCDVEQLCITKWRDWTFRLFVFGDYAFLCVLYGISGASGRHCCLWCLITQSELKEPSSERGLMEERTVEKLVADYDRFKEAGSVISKAKQYNNSIRPPLLNVPIDQIGSTGFQKCIEEIKQAQMKRVEVIQTAEEARECTCEEGTTYVAIHGNNKEAAETLMKRAIHLRQQEKQLNKQLQKSLSLKQGDGPCIIKWNETLKKLGVEQQAYHGGSFNGNHTDKCLLEKNIPLLVNVPVEISKTVCPELLIEAEIIKDQFQQTLKIKATLKSIK